MVKARRLKTFMFTNGYERGVVLAVEKEQFHGYVIKSIHIASEPSLPQVNADAGSRTPVQRTMPNTAATT
jgi:hypothetical protein